ncbi:MAG: 4'-phosphopantetheinyl transferase superfamily protein [Phycisphaerae bacterium]|nr:4'-phosphopantetheinyl transferase superfamily protein [Phycisphaerae bacterium]
MDEPSQTPGTSTSALAKGSIHVWRWPLTVPPRRVESLAGSLNEMELERAGRYHFETLRHKFIVAHAGLRAVLAGYTGIPAEQLSFRFGVQGKPTLVDRGAAPGLEFNLSDSQDIALAAVTLHQPIGVDIERVREIPELDSITTSILAPEELSFLRSHEGPERLAAFLRFWTCKEAIIKAMGVGLSANLKRIVVDAQSAAASRWFTVHVPASGRTWSVRSLPIDGGYQAALAIEGSGGDVDVREWTFPIP